MQEDNIWIPKKHLIKICIYLIILLIFFSVSILFLIFFGKYFHKITKEFLTILVCIFLGGVGGSIYCIKAVYFHACVKKNWDENWITWYFLRPILSTVIGGISYLFIKAGLILFSSNGQAELNQLSIWAFAFISGLNVDNFIKKIEGVSATIWGINPSRTSCNHKENKE